jgi:hypothetical protein
MRLPRFGVLESLDEEPEVGVVGAAAPIEEEVPGLGP